jgi:hypothetical protein
VERKSQVRMRVAEAGATPSGLHHRDEGKNPLQKLERAQGLRHTVVTSGDLFPFQTISWVF